MECCIFVSKIIMDLQKNLFAKKDIESNAVRFVAAIKITSKKFMNGNYNVPAILFALLSDYDEGLTGYQKNVVSHITLSKETAHLAKEMFIDIYNDKEAILDYLNSEISDKWFRMKGKTEKDFSKAHEESTAIIKSALDTNFFTDLEF